jgi:hypothetical protein
MQSRIRHLSKERVDRVHFTTDSSSTEGFKIHESSSSEAILHYPEGLGPDVRSTMDACELFTMLHGIVLVNEMCYPMQMPRAAFFGYS